jgi:hypothetical protein
MRYGSRATQQGRGPEKKVETFTKLVLSRNGKSLFFLSFFRQSKLNIFIQF